MWIFEPLWLTLNWIPVSQPVNQYPEDFAKRTNCMIFRETSVKALSSSWTTLSYSFVLLQISSINRFTSSNGCSYVTRQGSLEYLDWKDCNVSTWVVWLAFISSSSWASSIKNWIKFALVPLDLSTSERYQILIQCRVNSGLAYHVR